MAQKHNLTIQVVSIIGGILTAIFFLGFLALARIIQSEIPSLIIGTLLIITTLIISRIVIRPFLDAMNITLYIAGCVLAGFGMNANIHALFFILTIISILTFFLSVSKYYYDLNLSLLTKSITLFFIGIACITAWYFFTQKRTRHEKI